MRTIVRSFPNINASRDFRRSDLYAVQHVVGRDFLERLHPLGHRHGIAQRPQDPTGRCHGVQTIKNLEIRTEFDQALGE